MMNTTPTLVTSIAALGLFPPLYADIPEMDLDIAEEGFLMVAERPPMEAFDQLAFAVSLTYPLTDWKEADWDERYDELRPQLAAAVQNNDQAQYYRLIRDFMLSAPDGHISVHSTYFNASVNEPSSLIDPVGGSFGFSALTGDDGRLIVVVEDGGPAEAAGWVTGMELLTVEGIAAEIVLDQTSTDWTSTGIPTLEALRYYQGVTLGRAPIGESRSFEVKSPASGSILATVLSAVENEAVSLPGIDPFHDRADELLSAELLNETVGYIRLSTFHSAEVDSEEAEEAFIDEVAEGFADQLQALINAGATELILDLRGNEGGFDSLGARIASHFNSEDALYQTTVPFDLEEGWAEDPDDFDYLWTTPQSPQFGGRVVVLANHTTTSAGETFVEHLQAKEQTRYVGLWGTNGSNADLGGLALLPDGIIVFWPIEPCLTAEGEIRIDTRADLAARLTPDVPLAHTAENFHTAFDDGEDIEVQAALHVLDDPLFAYFSQSEKIAAGWWEDPLYGRYWTGATPWLYHVDFGWIYPSGRGGREQTFYHASWQWCWTSRTNFPWVYSHTLGWLYYIDGWYWTATTGEWQSL